MLLFGRTAESAALNELKDGKVSPELLFKMIQVAEKFSLKGNLVARYAAYLLITEENAYALACEKRKKRIPRASFPTPSWRRGTTWYTRSTVSVSTPASRP